MIDDDDDLLLSNFDTNKVKATVENNCLESPIVVSQISNVKVCNKDNNLKPNVVRKLIDAENKENVTTSPKNSTVKTTTNSTSTPIRSILKNTILNTPMNCLREELGAKNLSLLESEKKNVSINENNNTSYARITQLLNMINSGTKIEQTNNALNVSLTSPVAKKVLTYKEDLIVEPATASKFRMKSNLFDLFGNEDKEEQEDDDDDLDLEEINKLEKSIQIIEENFSSKSKQKNNDCSSVLIVDESVVVGERNNKPNDNGISENFNWVLDQTEDSLILKTKKAKVRFYY